MILALQWNINQGECCFDHDISTLIHPSWGQKENKDKLNINNAVQLAQDIPTSLFVIQG